jgi:hypothetical protein
MRAPIEGLFGAGAVRPAHLVAEIVRISGAVFGLILNVLNTPLVATLPLGA